MTNLAVAEPAGTAEVRDMSAGLLDVIARAARDPNVDIDKMERLLQMQERVQARGAKAAYYGALADMQPNLPIISERGSILNKNGEVQSTYALWEDVNEAIRPILCQHGFALSFKTRRAESEVTTTGILSHRDGHSEETELSLPSDTSGSKNAVQAVGSSSQYGKRYTAFALLNITSKGEDDDAMAGGGPQLLNGEPAPREKLDGKHPSKSKLQAAMREFVEKLRTADGPDAIEAIIEEYGEDLAQCRRYLPAWWEGDGTPEKRGVCGSIEDARARAGGSSFLSEMIDSMKANQTAKSLANWMDKNEPAVASLDDADARKFQLAVDLHESGLQQVATVNAG